MKLFFGIFLGAMSISFFLKAQHSYSLYLDGWQNALGKAIFMGVLGLALLTGGILLIKSARKKNVLIEEESKKKLD